MYRQKGHQNKFLAGSDRARNFCKMLVVSVAIAASLVFSQIGCSSSSEDNAVNSGELLFKNAKALSAKVADDPVNASPDDLNESTQHYQKVVDQAAGSVWAARALLHVASLQMLQGRNEQAKDTFNDIISNYSIHEGLKGSALLGLAKLYGEEENWNEAITVYDRLGREHTWTNYGIVAPLFISKIYLDNNDQTKYQDSLSNAAVFYRDHYKSAPTVEKRIQALNFMTIVYEKLEDWEKMIDALNILDNEFEGVDVERVLMQRGLIYQEKLNDTENARESYERLMRQFPLSTYYEMARARISGMNSTSEEQVTDNHSEVE